MECKSSGLCLFDEQDVQTDILGHYVVDYHPVSTLSRGAPIEFYVPGSTDEYIDCNDINMLLKVRITKATGKAIDVDDKVTFVNQPLSSLFQDVFLTIGDQQVEGGQSCYPYNAYLSSIIQFHPSAKKTHMQMWGFNEDEPGKFEDDANKGFKFRSQETIGSKTWELYGPLFLDMTRQSRYLLPQTDMRFKFLPSKDDFCLLGLDAAKTGFKVEIDKCILYVKRVRVNDSVISGHNSGLDRNNAKYLLQHTDIQTFTVPAGTRSFIKDRLFQSQTPKFLIVGLLEHEAFNGSLGKNPFNFQHFDLNKIALYRDGELGPTLIFSPNYSNGHYKRVYANTMSALHYYNTDDTNGMTLEHFEKGYNLYAFDLTPDSSSDAPYRSPSSFSSLRLEISFKTALTGTINVLIFSILDSKLEVTKLRDVIVNYNR